MKVDYKSLPPAINSSDCRGDFTLEGLPRNLYSLITEKMYFKDLKTFNMVSKLTASLCRDLKLIAVGLKTVHIGQNEERFEAFKCRTKGFGVRSGLKAPLSIVPGEISISTRTLKLEKTDIESILKHQMSAEEVEFCGSTGSDPDFVKAVLQVTLPEKVILREPCLDSLSLAELKEVNRVEFRPWRHFSDRELLAIPLEYFRTNTAYRTAITSDGVCDFLKEWQTGARNIRNVFFTFNGPILDVVCREFNVSRDDKTGLMICRGDETIDCVIDLYEHRRLGSVRLYPRKCQHIH